MKRMGIVALALALGACGNMASPGGGNNGGGASGGSGGGASGGSGGGASGGSGGGASGGNGGGASGGGSGGTPDYVSGTRIKARVQSTADGAKAFAGFYDTMLSTPCAFGHAADDTVRCLPSTYAYIASYFADSGCTTPVAYSSVGCAPAYANQTEAASACVDIGYYATNQRTHVFALGGAYTASNIWVGSPGSCTMTTPSAALTYYNVGSEVPASTFAAGSVDNAP